ADLDYFSAQACVDSLARTRGIRVIKIALPEPATRKSLIDTYAEAFAANPAVKMALLTHISHRTGLALPVAEIATLAKARGIDVIVDSAHSVGQLDFKLPETNADFIGMNVHKWLGAPLGVGAIYVRRDRQSSIDVYPAEHCFPPSDTRSPRASVRPPQRVRVGLALRPSRFCCPVDLARGPRFPGRDRLSAARSSTP